MRLIPRLYSLTEPRAPTLDTEYTECSTWYTMGDWCIYRVYPGWYRRHIPRVYLSYHGREAYIGRYPSLPPW